MATTMDILDQRKASIHFDSYTQFPLGSALSDEESEPVEISSDGRIQQPSRKFTFSEVNPHTTARDYYTEQNHTLPRHHNRTRTYSAVRWTSHDKLERVADNHSMSVPILGVCSWQGLISSQREEQAMVRRS